METLILRFNHSTDIFWPLDSTSPRIDLITTFPSLERLHLDVRRYWLPSWSLQLPSTLTSLQITPSPTQQAFIDVFKSLPSSLRHLVVLAVHEDFESNRVNILLSELIPPALETLSIHLPYKLASLNARMEYPRNLVHLHVATQFRYPRGHMALNDIPTRPFHLHEGSTIAKLELLPPFLSSLSLHITIQEKLTPMLLTALPGHLTSLDLIACSTLLDKKMVRALPRRLTHLNSAFKTFKGYKEGDFPPHLHSLTVPSTLLLNHNKTPSKFSGLPPLVTFRCYQEIPSKNICGLPRSIIDLNIGLEDITDVPLDLPPKLMSLSVSGYLLGSFGIIKNGKHKIVKASHYDTTLPASGTAFVAQTLPLKSIPRNLTSLTINCLPVPISDLIYLPRHLTFLKLHGIIHDMYYDPTTEAALDKAKEVCETLNVNSGLWGENPQVTMVDWLPRTLTDLTLIGQFDLPTASWSRLPPHLVSLSLYPNKSLSQDILHHLPMSHLQELGICLDQLDDEHFELIPAHPLSLLRLHHTTTMKLTERLAGNPKLDHISSLLPVPLKDSHDLKVTAFHQAAELDKFEDLLAILQNES